MSASPARAARQIAVGPLTLALDGDPAGFATRLDAHEEEPGLWLVGLELTSACAAQPPRLGLSWTMPVRDIHAAWSGDHRGERFLAPNWNPTRPQSRACSGAPVLCLHSAGGHSRMTIAGSDPVHAASLSAGVHEETALFHCSARWFAGGLPAGTRFAVTLRLDLRDLPLHQTISAVSRWWETLPGLTPARVPDSGRLPMYSTWYSLHQAVEPEAVERQCALAKALGCAAVIVDDGWQTLDGNRGYAFCGDWEPERIPDMAGHVRRVHALGMKFLLWYSVPFIGLRSRAHARFAGRYLREEDRGMGAAVLDPRYPEVREFLISLYERHLREWDLDGFKLDFVDSFSRPEDKPATAADGRDIADVDEAVVRLLTDVITRLRAIKPDVLIEFRQSYIGPVMRTVGNLFRAGDCPNDALGNRRRTLDIRLICGASACHADMLMWHLDDPVESAALQLLNVLFSVPQISVPLDRISADQRAMLAFWLGWWREHRACLLDGTLAVRHPEMDYTQAEASTRDERIVCAYAREAVACAAGMPALHVVNVTRDAGVILECTADLGTRTLVVRDCLGVVIEQRSLPLTRGLHLLAVPPAGLASLTETVLP